ncbi:MAG: HU family DNA-binding protein [Chloroflexota bacterium]
MNRVDLVAAVAEASDLSLKEANVALVAALEAMTNCLTRGEEVNLHGFGVFRARERAPRSVIHPQTKERLAVAPPRTVLFTPSAALRKRLAGDSSNA